MKFFFHTFGCRVNQYETEALREKLLADSTGIATQRFEDADVCVVNTCTVTREADKDALRLVRRIARRNPAARLVVTGCLASRSPEDILEAAPAAVVVGNDRKDLLPAMLGCVPAPDFAGISDFTGHSRAFVKIQDGCNMQCTYCIIPDVRPILSCRPYAEVEREVRGLIESGTAEVVLCGIRLGRYLVQDDAGRRVDFVVLIDRLLELSGDFRIRLSSLEVTDLTDRLLDLLVRREGRLCPSFHVPLQAGTDPVLRRMQRWYSTGFYARRVEALKIRWPDAGLFSDIMVGFPDETDELFEEGLRFIEGIGFSGLHVFRYSKRPETPAARYKDQVPENVLIERSRRMHSVDAALRARFAQRAVGSARRVLLERRPGGLEGVTDHFLRVRFENDLSAAPDGITPRIGAPSAASSEALPTHGMRGASQGRESSPVASFSPNGGGLIWARITGARGGLALAEHLPERPMPEGGLRPLRETSVFPYTVSVERDA